MNISSIQNLVWVGSLACASYLGWFLYEFRQPESQQRLVRLDNEFFKGALEEGITIPETKDHMAFDFPVVKRLFHDMNWSGKEPEKPVIVETPDEGPVEVRVQPIGDLVEVLFVRAATFDPSASQALVSYKDSQLSRSPTVEGGVAELYVNDRLPAPHDYAFVRDIVDAGILFGFDDEREDELVEPPVFKDGIHIVEAGPDGALVPSSVALIGSLPDAPVYRPENTIAIGPNEFRIGTEDARNFNDNYAAIISQLSHRRHRNPSTGQYDGIEIRDVPAGSIAAQHGVQSGDVIKSINGTPVSSVQEAIQFAKNNSEKYSVWEVVIENKGVDRTVTYETPSE